MRHRWHARAVVLWILCLAPSLAAAADPVLYTDNRATSSTFRDRGTSYAPTYLIDEFFWWMEANGLTRKPGDPDRQSRGRGGLPD